MRLTKLEREQYQKYVELYDFLPYIKDKTFLITGVGGMTGTAVVKWLLLENEIHKANVTICASTRHPEKRADYLDANDSVTYCEFGKEASFLEGKKVDYIIHGAAPTGREFFINKPVETARIIIDETEILLDIMKKYPQCRFLYLSSMDIYGTLSTDEPVTEDYISGIDQSNIRNGYALGKKMSEFLCHAYHKEYGVDAVIVRPASIQGLTQPYEEPRVFNELLRCLVEKKDLVLKSDGSVAKCFIYTLDAVSALFIALFKGVADEVYNITNRETFMPLRDLATALFEEFAPSLKVVSDIQPTLETGYLPPFRFVQSNEKIEKLGWKNITSLKEIYDIDIRRFS